MKGVLNLASNKLLDLGDIAQILNDLNAIKLKSDAFYSKIVEYIVE